MCLSTCAESAGLKRAFPQLAGLYTAAELARGRQGGGVGVPGQPPQFATAGRPPGRDDVEQPFPDDDYGQV